VEPGLDNVPVDVVAFKSMVDLHTIAHVRVIFFGGYRGFPALPGWEGRFGFSDRTQESSTVSFAVF
jgi:hypothetical protein